jgi:hypothetical protein
VLGALLSNQLDMEKGVDSVHLNFYHRSTQSKGMNPMKYLPLSLLICLCSCSPSDPLPAGYEIMRMSDGWYLRTNGHADMQTRYGSRQEALGSAILRASLPPDKVPLIATVSHTVSAPMTTNLFADGMGTNIHGPVLKQTWVEFSLQGTPFKALVKQETVEK